MSGSSRRKVRDAREAAQLLAAQADSGLSMSAWCAAEGIDGRSLSAYRSRLPAVRLLELAVPPVATPTSAPVVYRLVVADVVLELDDSFRADTLARLLDVVRAC